MNDFYLESMVSLEHANAAGIELNERQRLITNPVYDGRYLATTDGVIYSLRRNGKHGVWEVKQWLKKTGYLYVNLRRDLQRGCDTLSVHRLIALTFLPRPEGHVEVDHVNGIKTDNCSENLEWVTKSEQHIRAHRLGLKPGVGQFRQRKVAKIRPDTGEIVKIYYSINQAHREDGHKSGAITLCCQGKQRLHHGHKWKYMGE